MEKTLKVLNRMVKDGVINEYAIGGAVAAIYYLEPFDTIDLDVFIQIDVSAGDLMILRPVYEYLSARGYNSESAFIHIEGFPVQFLPVFNWLTEEAVREAQTIKYNRVTTRIMRAEHLVAIMLQTGRTKDYLRISMFLEQRAVNMRSLNALLKKYDLMRKWTENEYKFKP